jgi:hypothetical protein
VVEGSKSLSIPPDLEDVGADGKMQGVSCPPLQLKKRDSSPGGEDPRRRYRVVSDTSSAVLYFSPRGPQPLHMLWHLWTKKMVCWSCFKCMR